MQSQFCSSSLKAWLTTLAAVLILVGLALSLAARAHITWSPPPRCICRTLPNFELYFSNPASTPDDQFFLPIMNSALQYG